MRWLICLGALLLSAVSVQAQAALAALGQRPDPARLEPYQETITREEFERLLRTLYAPQGGWEPFIRLAADQASILVDSRRGDAGRMVLRFARSEEPTRPPRFWRDSGTARLAGLANEKWNPLRPLAGRRIALDPGHLGGRWAQMEERWFRIGDSAPVCEGDLTLAVAAHLAPRLEALGAEVLWVRATTEPRTPERPETLAAAARETLMGRGVARPPADYAGYEDPRKEESVRWEAERFFYRLAEIRARATRVNARLHPDLVLCIHFNAEAWGDPAKPDFVPRNHLHLLVNGNYGPGEVRADDVRLEMLVRLLQRVHEEELPLAETLATAMARATGLPPYEYTDDRARRVPFSTYVWARNLLANRLYECPVAYLEPYVMNSAEVFARVQAGDYEGEREIAGRKRPSIVREYADAVATGLAEYFAPAPTP